MAKTAGNAPSFRLLLEAFLLDASEDWNANVTGVLMEGGGWDRVVDDYGLAGGQWLHFISPVDAGHFTTLAHNQFAADALAADPRAANARKPFRASAASLLDHKPRVPSPPPAPIPASALHCVVCYTQGPERCPLHRVR